MILSLPGTGIRLGAEFVAVTGGDMTAFGSADRLAATATIPGHALSDESVDGRPRGGCFNRGFTGDRIEHVVALCRRHGVQVWLPEAGGPLDLDDPARGGAWPRRRCRLCPR